MASRPGATAQRPAAAPASAGSAGAWVAPGTWSTWEGVAAGGVMLWKWGRKRWRQGEKKLPDLIFFFR